MARETGWGRTKRTVEVWWETRGWHPWINVHFKSSYGKTLLGCGVLNQRGLQIKSYWSDDEAICTWQPSRYHMAGPQHILNGRVIATIIDCHCIYTAIAAAYRAEGRAMNTEPPICCVTASLQVMYLKPTPIREPVTLRARVKGNGEEKSDHDVFALRRGRGMCARRSCGCARPASVARRMMAIAVCQRQRKREEGR